MPHQTSIPAFLDPPDALDERTGWTDVLKLTGFRERLLVGALDTDKDADDVGVDHQPHQFLVLG
jgi:hypothetical protein